MLDLLASTLVLVPVVLQGAVEDRRPSRLAASGTPVASNKAGLAASFRATPTSGPASLQVQFTDSSTGSISAWSWDFGDGNGSSVRHPLHTYVDPGTYTVSLTVTGPGGQDTLVQTDLLTVDTLPADFVDELVFSCKPQTTGFVVRAPDDILTWTKEGRVWRWFRGAFCPEPMVDIAEEVGNWNDHGLHGFVLDPAYDQNGYVYLYYVVDRHYLDSFGTPAYDPDANEYFTATIGRVTRYTVLDPTDPATVVDPSTRLVLVGEGIGTGVPVCASSHGIGTLAFGQDGSLLFSCGDASLGPALQPQCLADGILLPKEDVGPFRSQLVDSANGKVHRIDPATGDGLPTNPFFDAASPRSWRSRTWALGLRQPFRFAVRADPQSAGPGSLYVGDVGDATWEELTVVDEAGRNAGWPLFEAFAAFPYYYGLDEQNLDAPNPLYPQPGCPPYFLFEDLLVEDSLLGGSWPNPCAPSTQVPASIPTFVHRRPAIAWKHRDVSPIPISLVKGYDPSGGAITLPLDGPGTPIPGLPFYGNISIGGTWYGGTSFPPPYQDVYFHGDFGEGWIKAFAFDEDDELTAVHEFASGLGPVVFLTTDPDQEALYVLLYGPLWQVHRIQWGGNAAPVAAAAATPTYGPSPLRVSFSAAGSQDPEGASLEVDWDFGENEPWTPLHALAQTAHVYPSLDVSSEAALVRSLAPTPGPVPYPRAAQDGVFPPPGSADPSLQTVVEGPDPWIGYRFPEERTLTSLVFQEGRNQGPLGGWLRNLAVEFEDPATSGWVAVGGLTLLPAYPSDLGLGFETFHVAFDPVRTTAIRLRDDSGLAERFTVAELRAIGLPQRVLAGANGYVASVTVTDPEGAQGTATVLVSTDNTPPLVTILSPQDGSTYPVGVSTQVPLLATIDDIQQGSAGLACEWQVELVHGNHTHPEPPDPACSSTFLLVPHGELEGDPIYWRFELRVTDAQGLTTVVQHRMLPEGDCNLNGILDALDIQNGTSLDQDGDGVPDECQGNAIGRFRRTPVPVPR